MKIFYDPGFAAPIGEHIMPMRKFALVAGEVRAWLPQVIMEKPELLTGEDLLRVHTAEYVDAVKTGAPRELAESQKFPWSTALYTSVCLTVGGVRWKAVNRRPWPADSIMPAQNTARASALSTALWWRWRLCARKAKSALQPSLTWTCTMETARHPSRHLPWLIQDGKPDILLYQAGADPLRGDPYSPLQLTHDDLEARDRMVFEFAKAEKIPVAWVLAGGYCPEIEKVVRVHLNTARVCWEVFGEN